MQRLPLQIAGLDLSVWIAVLLVHFLGEQLIRFFSDLSMNKMIYQHFSKNDSSFIDKGVEWIKKVEDSYSPFLTPFVNPHQEKILKVLASTNGIST